MFADHPRFKKAVLVSLIGHISLFVLFLLSPYLPSFQNKSTIFYVDMNSYGGGGGGGGGNGSGGASLESRTTESQEVAETTPPTRESLKDLTVPDSLEQVEPELRHPVDKPERKATPKPKKQAVIQKTETKPAEKQSRIPRPDGGTASSSGIRFGPIGGDGSGGGGGGGGSGSGAGNSLYGYYFDRLQNIIASNWLTAQIRSGSSAVLETHVRFRIYRDGRIGNVEITQSSDVTALDHSASRAVQSSRFPPLPQSMEKPYIILTVIFEHRR